MNRYQVSAHTRAVILRLAPAHYATWKGAPDSFAKLLTAYEKARRCGAPLPVYAGDCELSIYGSPEVNHAFRAWHDSMHVELGAEFDDVGEHTIAVKGYHRLIAEGVSREDASAVFADVWGQYEYEQRHGVFPHDQAAFVAAYLLSRNGALADVSFLPPVKVAA